jgi:hypothetical protein
MDPQMAQQLQMAQQMRAQQPAPAGQGALGGGMAQAAAQIMQSRPYQLHVQEAKMMGQQPMPPEQFAQQMMQQPRQ